MDRKAFVAGLLPALMLFACDRAAVPDAPAGGGKSDPTAIAAPPAADQAPTKATPRPRRDGVNDGVPDLAPPILSYEAERSSAGPRNVLSSFARALELKEFDQAWAMLSPNDKRIWSKPAFAALFAGLEEIAVAIPDGTGDAACGSAYYAAPVTVTAARLDGRSVKMTGEALLRRVNDVDGATPAQLRWHFEKLTLAPAG